MGGETGGSGLEQECGAKVLQRDGAQLFSNHWRRDQEEVAVTAEEEMEVRCRDGLSDGDRGAGSGGDGEQSREWHLSLLGTIRALNQAGSWV